MTGLTPLGPIWILSLLFGKNAKTEEKPAKETDKNENLNLQKYNVYNVDTGEISEDITTIEPQTSKPPLDKKGAHTIAKGETLFRIATDYGVSVSDLIKANPDLKTDKNGNKIIKEGELLKLPKTAKARPDQTKTEQKQDKLGKWEIEKSKGAFSVMSKFNLYKEELQKLNPDIDLENIKTGTKFNVPGYEVKAGDTFAKIAKEHDITEKMLKELNPDLKGLKAGAVVNVPKKAGDNLGFENLEIEVEEYVAEEVKTYTVKKGDTLSEIAQKNKVPVWALMISNNIKDEKIFSEQVLEIPTADDVKELEKTRKTAEEAEKKSQTKNQTHKVAKNEVLSKIAERHGIPTWAIIAKNNIENPNKLSLGQVLEIPDKNEIAQMRNTNTRNKTTPKVKTKTVKRKGSSKKTQNSNMHGAISPNMGLVTHRIKPKDTLKSIAKEYGVDVKDLLAYNKLKGISPSLPLAKQKITNIKIVGNQSAVKAVTGVSQDFLDDLTALEKKRRTLYDDGCKFNTIGYGHNTKANKDESKYRNRKLNDTEIYSLLARDILKAQDICKKHLKGDFNKLTTKQKEALYSLIFNTGGLSTSPSLLKAVKAGKHAEAAQQFNQIYGTVDGKKKIMPGLCKRRFVEISTYVEGSKLSAREMKAVMAKTQAIYDKGYYSIKNKNSRVDYNAYAKKFLGEFIDKGYIKIKS